MKITFFIPDLLGGGAQHMIVNMANEFARRDHSVTLLLGCKKGPFADKISNTVRVVDLGKARLITSYPALVSFLNKERPDIFLSAMYYVNIIALIAKLTLPHLRTKFIVTERNLFSLRIKGSSALSNKMSHIFIYLLYRFADQVVAISKGVADNIAQVAGLPADKVKWIHNPVVTKQTLKALEEKPESGTVQTNKDEPLLIASGRLVLQKDYPTLLRAFAALQSENPSRLLILGDGELRDDLTKLAKTLGIKERVTFAGFVKNPLPLMKQADLFVISSAWEGFGNVLVEALLCGLPIVATDCQAGPAEILDNGKFGTLVPVGDDKALSAAITEALSKQRNPKAQKERAMCFTVEKICDQYETLMNDLLGE